jgi:hypothetical protein
MTKYKMNSLKQAVVGQNYNMNFWGGDDQTKCFDSPSYSKDREKSSDKESIKKFLGLFKSVAYPNKRQCTCNVALMHVRLTIVAVGKQ